MIAETATTAQGKPLEPIANDNPRLSAAPVLALGCARPDIESAGRLASGASRRFDTHRAALCRGARSWVEER